MTDLDIILIGAGNVGQHLGLALHEAGLQIRQVFSRSLEKAEALCLKTGAEAINALNLVRSNAHLYILAVPDKAIHEVAQALSQHLAPSRLMVHCSGATPSTDLANAATRYGVFYPLQTFSAGQKPDFQAIPFCIYANEASDQKLLEALARRLSPKVFLVDDEQRAVLHVAAVFVNNFSNHLFQIGRVCCRQRAIFRFAATAYSGHSRESANAVARSHADRSCHSG